MAANSSLKMSEMEFLNYRVVELKLESNSKISTTPSGLPDESCWRIGIGLADVVHYKNDDVYVAHVSAEMTLLPEGMETDKSQSDNDDKILIATGSIYGVFRIPPDGDIEAALRDKLLLNQTPAILMPFLRAAITGMLALAGYGAMPLPLINMATLAEGMPRKIVEMDSQV